MKRFQFLSLLLVAALVFTACGTIPPAAETAPPQTVAAEPVPTEPAAPMTRTLIETHTIEQFFGDMAMVMKTEYSYDPAGIMKGLISYTSDMETSRTTFECDEHGNPVLQTAVSGDMTILTESENTYDETGNLVKKVDTVTRDGTVTDVREYHYNAEHKHTKVVNTSYGDNPYSITTTYEYDDHGNEISQTQENGTSVTSFTTEYEYDESGNILKEIQKNTNGEVYTTVDYTYNTDGLLAESKSTTPASPLRYTVTTYNEYGNPLVSESYDNDALTMRMTYTYVTVTVG